MVQARDGIHVYPVSYFRDLAIGKPGTTKLSDEEVSAIINDWLILVEAFGTFMPADWVEW